MGASVGSFQPWQVRAGAEVEGPAESYPVKQCVLTSITVNRSFPGTFLSAQEARLKLSSPPRACNSQGPQVNCEVLPSVAASLAIRAW